MMLTFCGKCYLRSYLALKLFIPDVIQNKLSFQYFISITCYNGTKYIIDNVSVIPTDDFRFRFVLILVFHPQIQNFIVAMV